MENKIVIDVSSNKKPINPLIYGNFIEHIGECIHNGLWSYGSVNVSLVEGDPRLIGMRQDVLEGSKGLNISVLRAFGGCYSDVYHWKDAIGPRETRKKVKNVQWGSRFPMSIIRGLGPKIDNQFGTDEFCHFCEQIGAEKYLNINYSTGTPEEAAQWVEYCNGTKNTEFGALRAKNGREKPYNVKFWGIANEIWGPQEVGREKDPEKYAEKYLTFAKPMREKDPNIKLIAVGWFKSWWNQAVLKGIGEQWIDYISTHQYVPLPLSLKTLITKKHPHKEKSYYSLMSAYKNIKKDIDHMWKDIVAVFGKDTPVRISFDEWGVWYKVPDLIKTNYDLQDGICAADILMTFQRMSHQAPMVNVSFLVNALGLMRTDRDGIILTPNYHALKLLREHSHDRLIENINISSDIFNSEKFGQISEGKDTPYIRCNVTINEKEDEISIFMINKHFSDTLTVKIELKNFSPNEKGKAFILNSNSPFDYNLKSNREKVQITESELTNIKPNTEIDLPAHSLTLLKLNLN